MDADTLSALETVGISLRPATDADFENLFDLNMATMRVYAEQVYGPRNEAEHRQIFRERFRPASTQIVVIDGVDAGMLHLEPDGDSVHLANIRVAPAYQGRGIGTRLIVAVQQDAHAHGRSVALRVFHGNPARFLYERLGFVVVGDSETHILMESRPPTLSAR